MVTTKLMHATALAGVLLATSAALGTASAVAAPSTVYVSLSAKSHNAGTSCGKAKYATIQAGIKAVASGGTVVVCKGTYTLANQNVGANKPLVRLNRSVSLVGQSATLNAAGSTAGNGAQVGVLITASRSVLKGFKITGAVEEGVVAEPAAAFNAGAAETPTKPVSPITHVSVINNNVTANNKGFAADFCQGPNDYPGDCGGGIHFNAVANSTMSGNTVAKNADGILITDDAGPSHHNLIEKNRVVNNTIECGITLPSHHNGAQVKQNPDGTFSVVKRTPSRGGVFNNVVRNNVSTGNGTHGFQGGGSGAGVLLAGGGPGTAVYNNVVRGNTLSGNGLAGVTVHAHYPGGEDLNGNSIIGNTIGKNNILGDTLDGPIMTPDMKTTGILLFTAPQTTFTVSGNTISNNTIGIWHNAAARLKLTTTTYKKVTTKIVMPRAPFGSAFCGVSMGGPPAPPCQTGSTTATVNGLIVANGFWTAYYVAYGTSPGHENTYTASRGAGSKVTPVGVAAQLSGLAPSTKYYYRIVSLNQYGQHAGAEGSFTTTS